MSMYDEVRTCIKCGRPFRIQRPKHPGQLPKFTETCYDPACVREVSSIRIALPAAADDGGPRIRSVERPAAVRRVSTPQRRTNRGQVGHTAQPPHWVEPRDSGFCETLTYYRLRHQMNQRQLAERLGVSTNSVLGWELGRNDPSTRMLAALADLFGTTMDDLWRGRR